MSARARSVFVKAAFWIPLAICSAVACTPGPAGVVADLSGVVAHATAFSYLALALCFAHFRRGPLLDVAIWLLAFGALLELAQLLFVAGRSGELLDLAIDGAGIGLGCALYAVAHELQGRRRVAVVRPPERTVDALVLKN